MDESSEKKARAALDAQLSQICQNPTRLKPKSLQPTPEAAKSRVTRLHRKKRMLIQNAKRASRSQPASDP